MSDLDFVDETRFDPDEAQVTKPSVRWRNEWRAYSTFEIEHSDGWKLYEAGEEYEDQDLYPSKETAEAAAIEWLIGDGGDDVIGPDWMIWLGAFPVSE